MADQAAGGSFEARLKKQSRQDKAAQDFLDITEPIRRQMVVKVREVVKESVLADPDMWKCVRSGLAAAVDQAMNDVELEIERNLHAVMLRTASEAQEEGPTGRCFMWCWYKCRAWVLHHYLPHDLYYFSKLKDPVYFVFSILVLLPIHGLRVSLYAVLLLMLAYPSPPDEYQLINFIVMCKGMQFLTSGVLQTFSASLSYYYCFSTRKDDLLACNNTMGPGATGKGLAVDYLGSITLVWIAFALLKRAKRHADPLRKKREALQKSESAAANKILDDEAGGRLHSLLAYDRRCFYVTILLLSGLTIATCGECWLFDGSPLSIWESMLVLVESPQFSANIFWCCVLYSILSAPFFPFIIPALQTMLCHCDATGYNEHGACVSFVDPAQKKAEEGAKEKSHMDLSTPAQLATSVLRILNEGRRSRDQNSEEFEYKFGDFTRGVVTKLTKRRPVDEPPDVESGAAGSSGESAHTPFRLFGRRQQPETINEDDGEEQKEATLKDQYKALIAGPPGEALRVAALRIPGTFKTQDGVTMFRIELDMRPSKDGSDSSVAAPRVVTAHRFSQFKTLSLALGQRCLEFPGAKFPPYYMIPATKAKLEQRRAGLEGWLQSLVQDEAVTADGGQWAAVMRVFLAPSGDDVPEVDPELLPAPREVTSPPQDDPVAMAAATAAALRESEQPPTAAAAMMQDVAENLQMLGHLAPSAGDELVACMAEVTEQVTDQLRNIEAPRAPQWAAEMVESAPSNAELRARMAEVTAQLAPPASWITSGSSEAPATEGDPAASDGLGASFLARVQGAVVAGRQGSSQETTADSTTGASGASLFTKMQEVIAAGGQARGEEAGEYRFGDFSRGLWAKMHEGTRAADNGGSEGAGGSSGGAVAEKAGGSSGGCGGSPSGASGGSGTESRGAVRSTVAPPVTAADSALPLDFGEEAELADVSASPPSMQHTSSPAEHGSADGAQGTPKMRAASASAIEEASPAGGEAGVLPEAKARSASTVL